MTQTQIKGVGITKKQNLQIFWNDLSILRYVSNLLITLLKHPRKNNSSLLPALVLASLFLVSFGITHNAFADPVTKSPTMSGMAMSKLVTVDLPFIQNIGQSDPQVQYYANTFDGTAFVTKDGLVYNIEGDKNSLGSDSSNENRGVAVQESFDGGTPSPLGTDKSTTQVNYFVGNNKELWKSNIPTYDALSLGQVWQNIDVVLKAHGKNVEKIFTIQPGGSVDDIKMTVDGTNSMSLDKDGQLIMDTNLGSIPMTKPYAYQEIDGIRHAVDVSYTINGNTYGFEVGNYDDRYPLVIDPLLASTFLGGNYIDYPGGMAVDPSGNVYVVGQTASTNFPATSDAYQTTNLSGDGGHSAFVSKFNPDLTALLASTYLAGTSYVSGNGINSARGITLDSSGNVYVVGQTASTNFPSTTGSDCPVTDNNPNGGGSFVSELNSGLTSILASTCLSNGQIEAVTLDPSGNVYITGYAGLNWPTTSGAYQTSTNNFYGTPFVSKLNGNLTALLASTFVGGSGGGNIDQASAITLDQSGNVYITGSVFSPDFPTTSGAAFPTTNTRGYTSDAFVSKLNPDLTALLASTFLGGFFFDYGYAITLDSSGNVYVAGDTESVDFPVTKGAYQTANGGYNGSPYGADNTFVSKFNGNLTSLLASTYLGGNSYDVASAITVDPSDDTIYVAGTAESANFPTTHGAYQTTDAGGNNNFVSRLNPGLTSLLASTYIGGDGLAGMVLDPSGNVYVCGSTGSGLATTAGAYQTTYGGGRSDAFVAEISGDLKK